MRKPAELLKKEPMLTVSLAAAAVSLLITPPSAALDKNRLLDSLVGIVPESFAEIEVKEERLGRQ